MGVGSTSERPNILLLLSDQHRFDWVGWREDAPVRTPVLSALAEHGMVFHNAVTPSPLCAPARAALATGRRYGRTGVPDNTVSFDLSHPTYYQHLRRAGYECAAVGKLDLHKPELDWGADGRRMLDEYGFTAGMDCEGKGDAVEAYLQAGKRPAGPYTRFLASGGLLNTHLRLYGSRVGDRGNLDYPLISELPQDAYHDDWISNQAVRVLRGFSRARPWHLSVNFAGPHDPFDATEPMWSEWAERRIPPPVDGEGTEDEPKQWQPKRRGYGADIENMDRLIGLILAAVEARGELEQTLVVYASDHGEMLGDHGLWGKRQWYSPSVGVPLVARGPGVCRGGESAALVELHDLAATFLDYADAETLPGPDALSLRAVLSGDSTDHRTVATSAFGDWRMVFDGRYKLVEEGTGDTMWLFDTVTDPAERRNVSQDYPHITQRLREHLAGGRTNGTS